VNASIGFITKRNIVASHCVLKILPFKSKLIGAGTSNFSVILTEQSRPDRDKYVRVLTDNVEPESLDQFEKRTENETTSLGYAYDYYSITHYGNNYYSTSTAETLEVAMIF
jgi:Astacin (Peptidase family M12A)